MQRRALIVADAAGPDAAAAMTLQRLGFAVVDRSSGMDEALEQLTQAHYDLVILPVQDADGVRLASLERVLHQERHTFAIGTAPQPDPDVIVRAMRAGVHEFLVSPPETKDLTAAVDRLMRRSQGGAQRGQVFAVFSGKGGLGTTSIAVNLAHGCAVNNPAARVALADLVVTGGDVRVFLNLDPVYDMSNVAQKLDRLDSQLLNSLLTPATDGVWALPGPDSAEADELLDASTVSAIIEALRVNYAFTVLDCEHHMSERTLAAMDAADRILLVTQLSVTALRSTQRTLTLCRRLGYPEEKFCVVVSRVHTNWVLGVDDATQALKVPIYWKLPNDYAASAAAVSRGVPLAVAEPTSKLAASYTELAAKLGGSAAPPSATNGNGKSGASSLRRLLRLKN